MPLLRFSAATFAIMWCRKSGKGRLSYPSLVRAPCHRIPCTAADTVCGPAAQVEWPLERPCRRRPDSCAQPDLRHVISSESLSHRTLPSDAPLMAANLTGPMSHVQRANALTAGAAPQDEQPREGLKSATVVAILGEMAARS